MDEQKKNTRRRGEILEEAILLAAWEELAKIGYTHLTMESVAARAGTNKAVLYRRWANKSELVVAALRKHLPRFTTEIPNTGNLREDVYTYFHRIAEPMKAIGAQTIRGLLTEEFGKAAIMALPQLSQRRSESRMMAAMTEILKNAELRGEVCVEKLTPRVILLPFDLLRCEIITRQEPISDEVIAEIVDDIFLPLVHV